MEKIERVSRELKYHGSILDFYADTIITPDGNKQVWDFIEHKGAAAVVPVLPDGRVVLVKQYRNALDKVVLEIPAGGIEPGEPMIEAAKRELEEETGYASNNLTKLLSGITAVAFCNEIIDVFLARDLVKTSQNLDSGEAIEVECYYLEEIKDMIFSGQIEDFKTIASVLAYESFVSRENKE